MKPMKWLFWAIRSLFIYTMFSFFGVLFSLIIYGVVRGGRSLNFLDVAFSSLKIGIILTLVTSIIICFDWVGKKRK